MENFTPLAVTAWTNSTSELCLRVDPQKDIYLRCETGIEYFQKSKEWLTNNCVTKFSQ